MRVGAWNGLLSCVLASMPAIAHARGEAESCMDEQQNGPETDVDCGGDCQPCWHRRQCRVPSDCASGFCADGRCRERVLSAGERPPLGYEVRMSHRDAPGTARVAGTAFLVASYAPAYLAAVSYPGRLGALYVPLLGPWLTLDDVDLTAAKFALVADGSVQIAGTVLLLGGFALAGRQAIRTPHPNGEELGTRAVKRRVDFAVYPGPGTIAITGRF